MTELWYHNPKVLMDNPEEFFPSKNLNRTQKINSLARFSIYYTALILVSKQDSKWLSIGIIIMLISAFLGTSEFFTSKDKTLSPNICQKPTNDNPFMNYTLGDLMDNSNRPRACKYDDVKDEMRNEFRSHVYTDSSDIWGKFISDRNYYTMPNTEVVNDQTGFALWCFGNSGECKSFGTNCLKQRDPTYHRGRFTTLDDDEGSL
jgi:hypothetical protein